ncbi:MAG TPA: heme-binding protein [Thermoanaerobaculia bacterium]|nr:heme-binding protein [Thermoanaerobaculia bacterium]
MPVQPSNLRTGAPLPVQAPRFGPLVDLAGTWVGSGFNLISRPGQDVGLPFVLQVNATKEVLTFDPINAQIINRGSEQGDLTLFAMPYSQLISDAVTSGLLHAERGMWLNVPPTQDPAQPHTIVRLATIPHGDSVVAQGTSITVPSPVISPVSPAPFNPDGFDPTQGTPVGGGYFPPQFQPPQTVTGALPPGFDITNPNAALTSVIEGQNITNTVVLEVSTTPQRQNGDLPGPFGGGILNIPFVTVNANAVAMKATFWIETVEPPDAEPFLQLQYTQTVILNFIGINWPHISVATLVKN